MRFLAALPIPKLLPSASSSDILKFLVWKDRSGRTKVHQTSCPELGKHKASSCDCPSRLSAGTVENLIGKLRAIFIEAGLGGEWDDRLGIGNPVSHPSIKSYLRSIKEEQAQARVRPRKSIPLFLDKLQRLAEHIMCKLRTPGISPISLYLLSRDLCFFSVDFFSGDRSSDLGRVMSREVLFFPQCSGILFNHTFGKTLRGDSVNTFAVKRCDNQVVCPVRNFERYLSISKLLRIDLSKGYLFRATKGNSVLEDPFIGSAVYNRLKSYLRAINSDEGETPHSSRSGCSITLSLLGVPKESIANHVGWTNSSMVDHYSDLRDLLLPSAPAAILANSASADASSNAVAAYKACNDLSLFKKVFP